MVHGGDSVFSGIAGKQSRGRANLEAEGLVMRKAAGLRGAAGGKAQQPLRADKAL